MKSLITTTLSAAAGLALSAAASAQHGLPAEQAESAREATAHAANAADHGSRVAEVLPTIENGIVPFIVSIVVFAVVFVILAKMVWPKILGGLRDRENKIREEIEAAEMARKQAKDALEEYQQSLAQARAEAQKMIESTRAQQSVLAAELRSKAEVELNQLRERALRDIETAKKAAVAEIYNQYTTEATMMASKILRRAITPQDTQRLVEESLQQLQGAKG
jgi:F-type H+-transporting ATPase subunit b